MKVACTVLTGGKAGDYIKGLPIGIIQLEMSTARQFLFTARVKGLKEKQIFDTANRIEKIISEQGFEVNRIKKDEIKRYLAIYFEASMEGDHIPDVDGEQWYEVTEDEEE